MMASVMSQCLQDLGCDLHLLKSEWMEVPSLSPNGTLLHCLDGIQGAEIAQCGAFRYLGSPIISTDEDAGSSVDVTRRCGLAHAAFGKLRHVWKSSSVSHRTKARLLSACVAPVLLYGSESWCLGTRLSRKLHATWMSCVRRH